MRVVNDGGWGSISLELELVRASKDEESHGVKPVKTKLAIIEWQAHERRCSTQVQGLEGVTATVR